MSVRKFAGLATGFALAAGLVGAGVSAQWTKQVTAQENINVGSFGCAIVPPSTGAIAPGGNSVSFTAPPIVNTIPGQAAFSFTVKNTGTVPQNLTISSSGVSAPFTDLLVAAPKALNGSDTTTYNGGVSWGDLSSYTNGLSASITYTVNCTEKPAIAVVVTGPVVAEAPLAGNVLKLTTEGVGFDNGPAIVLSYTADYPYETYDNVLPAFGHLNPTTSSFSAYFEDNCNDGTNAVITDVPFTVTATQVISPTQSNVATFTGTLACSQVHN